jgi:cytochrome c-type biogenesis protein CcmE
MEEGKKGISPYSCAHLEAAVMKLKFIIGGLLILAAVVYLIISSTNANAQYFLTVEEVLARGPEAVGKNMRISGAVLGDTIQYDSKTLDLNFTIAHVPADNKAIKSEGGLAEALHAAVADPSRARLPIIYNGELPDLLKNEAQAIVIGHMGEDGTFYADDLQLKCPTKYEEAIPEQSQ